MSQKYVGCVRWAFSDIGRMLCTQGELTDAVTLAWTRGIPAVHGPC